MRTLAVLLCLAAAARAGHESPNYIDGCQSADGRYVVTAEQVEKGQTGHGPNKWRFHWKDTKTGQERAYDAQGVQGGQVFGHLFVPPGGETFAFWNHVTMWTEGKSNSHQSGHMPAKEETEEYRRLPFFSKRLIIYDSKDGHILKEFAVADFLKPEEWSGLLPVFNRVHWITEYEPLHFKKTPRGGYAFYQISPDYSVLEFRVVPPRGVKVGRLVRVRLADGKVLAEDEKLVDKDKIPVRPFVGPDQLDVPDFNVLDSYVASIDAVRKAGKFAVQPISAESVPQFQPARLIKDGYQKADTPTWVPEKKWLLFTDLEAGKVYKLENGKDVSELGPGGRGRVTPDGKAWVGIVNDDLVTWKFGEEKPAPLLAKASLNDIAIGPKFIWFTTLKDPEKGRLTVIDRNDGKARVLFDGEKETNLVNPNGVALSPDGKHLYIGISSYKDKKHAGVYRFPVADDGSIDVAAGKKAKWYNVPAPDGIVVDPAGNAFITVGNVVAVVNPEGKKLVEMKIPKGSGTNLCFGGPDGRTLYVTTNNALYAFDPKE